MISALQRLTLRHVLHGSEEALPVGDEVRLPVVVQRVAAQTLSPARHDERETHGESGNDETHQPWVGSVTGGSRATN